MRSPLCARHVGLVGSGGPERIPLSRNRKGRDRTAQDACGKLLLLLVHGHRLGSLFAIVAGRTVAIYGFRARREIALPIGRGGCGRRRGWEVLGDGWATGAGSPVARQWKA